MTASAVYNARLKVADGKSEKRAFAVVAHP